MTADTIMTGGTTAIVITHAIRRIADAYPADAFDTPRWVRERYFTDDQRAAWTLRFNRPEAIEVML